MEQIKPDSYQDLIVLTSLSDSTAAVLVRGLLQSNGVTAFIDAGEVGPVTGEMQSPISSIHVLVHERDFAEARRILDQTERDSKPDLEWQEQRIRSEKRARFFGRIPGSFAVAIFGMLSYLSWGTSEQIMAYFCLGCALFFCLVLVFSFDRNKRE